MNAVRLVARREFTERVHERSFLISTGLTLAIIIVVVALPSLFGFGDPSEYRVSSDAAGRAVVERAAALDERFDAVVLVTDDDPDVTLEGGVIKADEEPDDTLVDLLQVANQQLDADARPPLRVETVEPIDPDRDAKAATRVLRGADALRAAADLRVLGRGRRRRGEVVAGDRGPAGHDPAQGPARREGDRPRIARARPVVAGRGARDRGGGA